jgi:hypothetical protein
MPASRKKRKKDSPPAAAKPGRKARRDDAPPDASRQLRAGMPAKDSVVSETTFTSPKGTVYRMIETDEADEYEET